MKLSLLAQGLAHKARNVFLGKSAARTELLQQLPKNADCAEIGVWKGEFSQLILESTEPRELHLIDPWAFRPEYPDRMYGGTAATQQADMERIYESVVECFSGKANVVIHRKDSIVALSEFPDGYLDWLYIDGDHSYESVLEDLRLAQKKVKERGIIAGDDYTWALNKCFPVQRAVHQFLKEQGQRYRLTVFGSQFMISV